MLNLKEIRDRITSISSTMQITNAMKMVSASKLKKSQNKVRHCLLYYDKIEKIFCNIYKLVKTSTLGNLLEYGDSNVVLIIVISSNRGLCGSFNSLIIKKIQLIIKKKYFNKKIKIFSLGEKAGDVLFKLYDIFKNQNFILNNLNFVEINQIIKEIISSYINNDFYEVILIYNNFKNFMTQTVIIEKLLPIRELKAHDLHSSISYIFEPNKENIINKLIPTILSIRLYKALLQSQQSEHIARMIAMHQATENAKFIKNDLILEYNKIRQSVITKEILEIISGASSL